MTRTKAKKRKNGDHVKMPRKIRKLNDKKQIAFLRSILTLAKANLTQKEIAQRLLEYGSKVEKQMGYTILEGLEVGLTFSHCIKPWLSPMPWEALLAGEKMGNWNKGLTNALKVLEVSGKVGGQIFLVLLKPIGMITFMSLAAFIASTKFFPIIADIYPMNRWGSISLTAYNMGKFFGLWGVAIILTIIMLSLFVYFSLIYLTGKPRILLDKAPIFRQYRLVLGSNLLRSIGNLSQAGFGLKESVKSTLKNSNKYQSSHLNIALKRIGQGKQNIGDIFDTGLLQASEQSTLKVLGEKGNYGETLLNCADITQDNLIKEAELVKTWGGNLLNLVGGLMALLLMAGIGLVMFDLSTNIS